MLFMKIRKIVCASLAGIMLFTASAMAKDNIYAYNKFISTILGLQLGYCDFASSFVGHESEYDNVNDYFSGLISAFYDDIDGDLNNELVTVESSGISVYRMEDSGVVFLGALNKDLIANYGDSYANVFTVTEGRKQYVGLEVYGKTINSYAMYLYDLNPETDDFKQILSIERESNEDGTEEKVWAKDKTYYSYTNGGGIQTSVNPNNYSGCGEAAEAALADTAPGMVLSGSMQNRLESSDIAGGDYHITVFASGIDAKTYIKATGLRFSEKPIVLFEDYSRLSELAVVPDIVTVTVDGETVQFLNQDPVIVDGRTLVPVRGVFEALGAEVEWIGETSQVVVTAGETTITLTLDSEEYYVNGEVKTLDVPAQLMNDRTMVPLRAISESLGCNVDWNDETKTVTILSTGE